MIYAYHNANKIIFWSQSFAFFATFSREEERNCC